MGAALWRLISWKTALVLAAALVCAGYGSLPAIAWLSEGLRSLALLVDADLAEPTTVTPFLSFALSDTQATFDSWYHYWDERMALGLVVLYAVFVQPRLPSVVAGLLALFLLLGIVTLHVSLQVVALRWLPAEYLLAALVVSYITMALWTEQRRRWGALERQSTRAHSALAREFLKQQRLEETLDVLSFCQTTEPVLDTYYELALKQEAKRQYAAAIRTFRLVSQRRRNYRDVPARLAQLESIHEPQHASGGSLAQTLAMSSPLVSLPKLGRYQLEREIGRGAMGVVYLGRDPKIGRRVAIKTLTYAEFDEAVIDDLKARFYREAEAAGRLSHPNIVTVYDVGEEDDLSYIAMDYAEGEPLNRYCQPSQLLPVATVYQIVAEVADALHYAHQQRVVHRDIKPGNLIYNATTEQLKVTDFGIARMTDNSNTQTGEILGSPIYLSPEVLQGEKATGAADIYSLGVSFYQLLTGHVPFSGDNVANVAYQIVHSKYKSARSLRSDLPHSAVRIINRAMARDPDKRFADAGEMAAEIRKRAQRDFKLSA
ncbi:MAG: serine/threonine-protein kinase [Halieaceae bacterium]|jgi:serine/threonine-protein kinase|nr:serine/threonine-protein kinase [Halieaceae bacterium]